MVNPETNKLAHVELKPNFDWVELEAHESTSLDWLPYIMHCSNNKVYFWQSERHVLFRHSFFFGDQTCWFALFSIQSFAVIWNFRAC